MKLPILPQTDNGKLYVSNSMIKSMDCPRRAWMAYCQRRIRNWRDPAMGFGEAIHAALDVERKAALDVLPVQEAVKLSERAVDKAFQGVVLPEDEYRTNGRCKEVLAEYRAYYAESEFQVISSEATLEKPLGHVFYQLDGQHAITIAVIYQGKIDAKIRHNGKDYVMDTKTSKYFNEQTVFDNFQVSPQMMGYCWLDGESDGAMIDTIVVRKPATRVVRNAQPRTEFHRHTNLFTKDQLEEWRNDTLDKIQQWLDLVSRSHRPPRMERNLCAWPRRCEYYDVCTCKSEESRQAWLAGGEFIDKPKTR